MARRSVLTVLVLGVLASACVTVAPISGPTQPTAPDFSFVPPIIPPVVIPTLPPEPIVTPKPSKPTPTAAPADTSQPTTSTQTPAPTDQPQGSNGPGFTPPASPIDISALLTSTVGFVNLSDSTVSINLDIYDSGSDQGTIATKDITSLGSLYQNVLEATYSATFTGVTSSPLTCVFDAHSGSEIDFTSVNGDVLVSVAGATPAAPDDLFVETSSLCKSTGS